MIKEVCCQRFAVPISWSPIYVSERASSLDASWLGDARHTCAVSRATQLIFHANIFLLLPLFLPHSTIFQRAPPFHHPQGPPRAIILSLNLLV